MVVVHNILFMLHVIVGSMALILFWLPIASKKGGLDHQKFGRYYSNVMYLVAFSGALMATLVIANPVTIKGLILTEATQTQQVVNRIQIFHSFLLFLSLITFVSVRHGNTVLRAKYDTRQLRTAGYQAPIILLLMSAVVAAIYGMVQARMLFAIFGLLGFAIAWSMLRYCRGKKRKGSPWITEHFGAMIGSGIGAYTAFFAFGGRQIFSDLGNFQLIFWIAPGVIGSIYIAKLSRRYS